MASPAQWKYHRNRYSTAADTVQREFPQVAADPVVVAALAQIQVAELALSARMEQLEDGDGDNG